MNQPSSIPQYVLDLVELYGPPCQDGDTTAVFYDQVESGTDLDQVALRHYHEYYVADLRRKLIPGANWLQNWSRIYQRPANSEPDFFRDLRAALWEGGLDFVDRLAGDLDVYLYPDEEMDDWSAQRNAAKAGVLAAAFDGPEVDFRVYSIGDDSFTLEGIFILGGRPNGEVIMLAAMSN